MTIQDDFRQDIEAFLARHDMKPAVFGTQALKDPKFVFDLRNGRSPSSKTIDKVRAWMAEQDGETPSNTQATPAVNEAETAPEPKPKPEPAPAPKPEPFKTERKAEKKDKPPAAPPPEGKKGGSGFALFLAFIALLCGGAALAVTLLPQAQAWVHGMLGQETTTTEENNDVAALEAVVDALQDDVNALRQDQQALRADLEGLSSRFSGGQDGNNRQLAGLADRITTLESRLRELESQPRGASSPAVEMPDMSNLESGMSNLESGLTEVRGTAAANAAEIDSLRQDLADIRNGFETIQETRAEATGMELGIAANSVISAFLRLDADIRSGRPYATSLSLYERQAANGEWPGVQGLEPAADTGIATKEQLVEDFDDLIPALLASTEEGDSWDERLMSRLRGIISVRKRGDVDGMEPEAVIARAEAAIARDDVATALDELQNLSEGKQALADEWMEAAETRQSVLAALERMADAMDAKEEN